MIKNFSGINISSRNPEALARFYNEKLGVRILGDTSHGYDGVEIGFDINQPIIWIWDEVKWGKSNFGAVTFVFKCDDLNKTYEELKRNGVDLEPPVKAVWGGTELHVKDPDGNHILMLD